MNMLLLAQIKTILGIRIFYKNQAFPKLESFIFTQTEKINENGVTNVQTHGLTAQFNLLCDFINARLQKFPIKKKNKCYVFIARHDVKIYEILILLTL